MTIYRPTVAQEMGGDHSINKAALIKKQVELREFDDKLKHYADMRISLDLDDGVKVNYGKFGDLLADVKAITGSAPEVN